MPPIQRPKPLPLSEMEIRAVLAAIGDDAVATRLEGRPDLATALVRAKRMMRAALDPIDNPPAKK